MNGHVTGTSLKTASQVDQVAHLIVGFHLLAQFRHLFNCLLNADVAAADRRRNHLGDSVDLGIRHVESPPDVLNRRLRRERPKRHNLADGVAPIEV